MGVVCFRARRSGLEPAALDRLDQELLEAIHRTGEVFLSHTRLLDRFTLRMALGGLRTISWDGEVCWELLLAPLRRSAGRPAAGS